MKAWTRVDAEEEKESGKQPGAGASGNSRIESVQWVCVDENVLHSQNIDKELCL